AGQVQLAIFGIPPVLTQVKNGKLRALGVTGKRRSAELPEVPTVEEAGVPGYEVNPWYGLLAPAGTPAPIVARLSAAVTKIVRAPEMREQLSAQAAEGAGRPPEMRENRPAQGAEPAGGTPEEFAAVIRADTALWTRVIREAGIKGE